MKEKRPNRTRIIGIRLTIDEFTAIDKQFKATTCRKLSDYTRNLVLGKPVVSTCRNRSTDDLIEELSVLRNELNHIGNNFNQSVKRLHTLTLGTAFKSWQIAHEIERKTLFNKIDEIKRHMQKITETWLQ